ncbi:MAG TPA: peptidylprolyl isomerase [Burkholderiales bacterium]|nr:peptidylprolyl isomerase [Burkholderiales bacterium]
MKLRRIAAAALAAAALALPASVLAQAAAKDAPKKAAKAGPVATVNGVAIPAAWADVLLHERESQGAPDNAAMRDAVREDLINRELIAQQAARSGYTKKPGLQAELALVRQTVIVQHYVSDWLREHPISDAAIQKEYDQAKAKAGGNEYKVRHILLDTEDEAKSAISALDKGASFEELAKKSKDAGTRDRGGELGWMAPGGSLDKAFGDAMVKLDKGKYSEKPVHTRYGYHVIQVEDVRPLKFPSLEEVKPRIEQQLRQNQLHELVEGLRAKAKIE